jgi:hypothetical protein
MSNGSKFYVIQMSQWLKERGLSLLDNALYEGVRLLILAIALTTGYAIYRSIRQQPLQWIVLLVFIAIGVVALSLIAISRLRTKNRTNAQVAPQSTPTVASTPKIRLSAGPNVTDSYSMNSWGTMRVRFLHPVVSIDSGTIKDCTGYLQRVKKKRQRVDDRRSTHVLIIFETSWSINKNAASRSYSETRRLSDYKRPGDSCLQRRSRLAALAFVARYICRNWRLFAGSSNRRRRCCAPDFYFKV